MAKSTIRIQRLAKREEKAILRRIFYLSAISIVLAVLLFTVGVSILGKFVDLLGLVFKGKDTSSSEEIILQPPVLDELPQATNSARLSVKGFVSSGDRVAIYIGDKKTADVAVSDSKFEYEDLSLTDGENKISAKTSLGDKTSDFSNVAVVVLDTGEPLLEIESPSEGQTFAGNNRVKVSGKTDLDAQVYANGFLASVNFEGKFEVLVPLAEGESEIEIKVIDPAGNTKVEKRKVTFRK